MPVTLRRLLLVITLALPCVLCAQDPNFQNPPSPITTDRPAFTDSSIVVPKGSLQIENGFQATTTAGQGTFDLPESLLRFAVAGKTELRLTVPDYFGTFASGKALGSGWSDLLVGVKQQLGPFHGFDLSLVVSLSFPTGPKAVSSHGYDPEIQLPWSRKLSENWTAAGMLSVYWPTQGASRNVTGQTTSLFDRQLAKPWDAFVEYIRDFPERGGPEHILHIGTAYKITNHQQLDLHGGIGLSASAPDHFIGFGYSVLFDQSRSL